MTIRNIYIVSIDTLPAKAHVGLTFRPAQTDSIGTVLNVTDTKIGNRRMQHVTYSYAHDPEQTYTRPYNEVRDMAFMGK